ncbi:SUR7/PalI family-domain-containing protein [Jackrogersella minutella]|nr:SUR7/PalI family-domain-containing protein [Jackrogersella minutella]
MGVGRYVCVALPFLLTVGSIICMLIAGLTGVANNSLYLFQIDTRNVSIEASTLESLIGNITSLTSKRELGIRSPEPLDISSIISSITGGGDNSNITAADLGVDNIYDVTLWNYCTIPANGTDKNCTKAKFNWAETEFSTDFVDQFANETGANITIPEDIKDALNTFKPLMKWTEVVYIIAMVALGLELVIGLFTACSRVVSCLTWLISGIATLAVIAASAMMTAMAVVVVGAVKGAIGKYGGGASWNNSFLACIWIGVAFALGASLFWAFSICCCAPEKRPYAGRSRRGSEHEKFLPTGSYAPLGEQQRNSSYNYAAPQRGGARSDMAYEPYSHAN